MDLVSQSTSARASKIIRLSSPPSFQYMQTASRRAAEMKCVCSHTHTPILHTLVVYVSDYCTYPKPICHRTTCVRVTKYFVCNMARLKRHSSLQSSLRCQTVTLTRTWHLLSHVCVCASVCACLQTDVWLQAATATTTCTTFQDASVPLVCHVSIVVARARRQRRRRPDYASSMLHCTALHCRAFGAEYFIIHTAHTTKRTARARARKEYFPVRATAATASNTKHVLFIIRVVARV